MRLKNNIILCLWHNISLHANVLLVLTINMLYEAFCSLQKFPPQVPTSGRFPQYHESVLLNTHAKKGQHLCTDRSYSYFSRLIWPVPVGSAAACAGGVNICMRPMATNRDFLDINLAHSVRI